MQLYSAIIIVWISVKFHIPAKFHQHFQHILPRLRNFRNCALLPRDALLTDAPVLSVFRRPWLLRNRHDRTCKSSLQSTRQSTRSAFSLIDTGNDLFDLLIAVGFSVLVGELPTCGVSCLDGSARRPVVVVALLSSFGLAHGLAAPPTIFRHAFSSASLRRLQRNLNSTSTKRRKKAEHSHDSQHSGERPT